MVELLEFGIDRLDVEKQRLLVRTGLQRHVVFTCSLESSVVVRWLALVTAPLRSPTDRFEVR